jgi:hypothetical protein
MTIRAINEQEVAVIRTTMARASVADVQEDVLATLNTLKIVDRCSCGCASVDFVPGGQAPPYRPIADALGTTNAGGTVGIIIWGSENAVTGLEIYDAGAGEHDLRLPSPETIR